MDRILWGFTYFEKTGQPKENAQRRSFAGRWVLRELLSSKNLPPRILYHPQYGYPQVEKVFCSIAHTGQVAVAAISSCPVGIDIEEKDRALRKVSHRISDQSERDELGTIQWELKNKLQDPEILLWVGKEAFSKALGLGLQIGFQNVKLSFGSKISIHWKSPRPSPLSLRTPEVNFLIHKDYLVGFCSEAEVLLKSPQCVEIPCPDFSQAGKWARLDD